MLPLKLKNEIMTNFDTPVKLQPTSDSVHIALGAGLIVSTLFLVAASLVAVGCLIASTQSIGDIEEGSDDSMRVMFWYGLSMINVTVFYWFGIAGLRKTMRGYKDLDRLANEK
jgi:hypothetical protein